MAAFENRKAIEHGLLSGSVLPNLPVLEVANSIGAHGLFCIAEKRQDACTLEGRNILAGSWGNTDNEPVGIRMDVDLPHKQMQGMAGDVNRRLDIHAGQHRREDACELMELADCL